jgi:predicted RNA binding protein YcfA (HicA-like mRNA interferase family)
LAKPRRLSGQEVCRILERHGFQEARRKGSHIVMQKKMETSTITVPVPNYKELRMGTLLSIIRQSGLPRSVFE